MHNYVVKNFTKSLAIFSFIIIFFASPAFSEETDNATELINEAEQYLLKGEYRKSIIIYDNILEIFPADSKIYEMKGIALSNIRLQSTLGSQEIENPSGTYDILNTNKLSMIEFYKALEINPTSVISLNGLGIGFGNFGEYDEAKKYFARALEIEPENFVTKNYLDYIEKTIKKYPTNQTEKPPFLLKLEKNEIPYWIKTNAGWWASDKISDNDFISGIQYLVKNKIIRLDSETVEKNSSNIIPAWIKNNAKWWSAGKISDESFLNGIKYLITNGMINVSTQKNSEMVKKELERTAWNFERYLEKIKRDIENEDRYIEYPNPSDSVIIKYWKEPHRWNLGQYLERPKDYFEPAKVFTDGDTVGAKLDRNGLRPLRYSITKDGLIVMASEAGVVDIEPEVLVRHRHMESGEILGVALDGSGIINNATVKNNVATTQNYSALLQKNMVFLKKGTLKNEFHGMPISKNSQHLKYRLLFGFNTEDINRFLIPMANNSTLLLLSVSILKMLPVS